MTVEDLISSFIVNQLGINLCSVKSIGVDRQDDGQIKEIKIEFIPAVDGNATKELDENEVEFYKSALSDMIPYNDKNYDEKLDAFARICLIAEKDPEFIEICEEHDRMIEEDGKENE